MVSPAASSEQESLVGQWTDDIERLHEQIRNDTKIDRVMENMVQQDEKAQSTQAYEEDSKAYNELNLKLGKEARELGDLRTTKHEAEAKLDVEYDLWQDSVIEREMETEKLIPGV